MASTGVAAVLGEIRAIYGMLVRSGRIHGLMICDADDQVPATDSLFDPKFHFLSLDEFIVTNLMGKNLARNAAAPRRVQN